jgi:hypothetical protein
MNQQEGRPRKIRLTGLSHISDKITRPVPAVSADTVIVSSTNRRIFWPVLLAGLCALSIMLVMVANDALAMAASVPVPMTITASKIASGNMTLIPGLSKADNQTPVGVVQMDATITNQVIQKSLSVPGLGTVTVKITTSQPVTVKGLTLDLTSLKADQAQFTNLQLTTSGLGFEQSADSQTLTNATIESPYLLANSITLPGLSLSVSLGS